MVGVTGSGVSTVMSLVVGAGMAEGPFILGVGDGMTVAARFLLPRDAGGNGQAALLRLRAGGLWCGLRVPSGTRPAIHSSIHLRRMVTVPLSRPTGFLCSSPVFGSSRKARSARSTVERLRFDSVATWSMVRNS